MTEDTNDLTEAWRSVGRFDQPAWKPPARHRVDPMRPSNPHTADTELEDLYQDFYRERVGRTGQNLTVGLILLVIFFIAVTLAYAGLWAYGTWVS